MIFLIDQQLPRKLAAWIRARGHDALHVRELGMEEAGDRDIWREADSRGAVIVTKDEDFSIIVRGKTEPKVIWVRTGNCSNTHLIARMERLWPFLVAQLEAGVELMEVR